MSNKYDKYIFRVYNIGAPTAKTEKFFQDKYKGDDAYFMTGPYMGNTVAQYDINKYKKLGTVQKEPSRTSLRKDWLHRTRLPDNAKVLDNIVVLPHKGLSAIGLADPQYSVYDPFNIIDKPFKRTPEGVLYNTALEEALDYKQNAFLDWYHKLTKVMPDFQDKINKAITSTGYTSDSGKDILFSNKDFTNEQLDELYNKGNTLFANWKDTYSYGLVSPKGYSYGYKPSYYNMLRAISDTIDNTQANGLALAAIPEKALYTTEDLLNKNNAIRAMRDFPEELVVKRLKPVRLYSGVQIDRPNYDYYYDDEAGYEEDMAAYYNSRRFNSEDTDIVDDLPSDETFQSIQSFFNWTKELPFEEREKRAKDFVYRHFDIDPDNIVSDETKKDIYADLSSWYNKQTSQDNICDALTQGGRRWQ